MIPDPPPAKEFRNGTLGYYSPNMWKWETAAPGTPYFSTVTMAATHYVKDGKWLPIYEDDKDDTTNP
jgi:hypothetical protein